MHDIHMAKVTGEFALCWQAAGRNIERQAQGPIKSWLKADLTPPFLEHLSFRLGNQLFFVRIEDVRGELDIPGNSDGVLTIADGCRGHPCVMPMRKTAGEWAPDLPGWGLVDVRTGTRVDPPALITDALIEMTDWEVHDFAVQVVRQQLEAEGHQIMSSQGNPSVDPSLWFVGDKGPEWVVVRAARYPVDRAAPPSNWPRIAESCARLSTRGNFASVSVANADQQQSPEILPLWRGHALVARYAGLEPRR